MRCNHILFSFALIVFLYTAGIFAWAIGQEIYRVAFAGAGVFTASWLVCTLGYRLHD